MEPHHAVFLSTYAAAVVLGVAYLHKDELSRLLENLLEHPISEYMRLISP